MGWLDADIGGITVREALAQAWEQGYRQGRTDCGPWQYTESPNPYREGAKPSEPGSEASEDHSCTCRQGPAWTSEGVKMNPPRCARCGGVAHREELKS